MKDQKNGLQLFSWLLLNGPLLNVYLIFCLQTYNVVSSLCTLVLHHSHT